MNGAATKRKPLVLALILALFSVMFGVQIVKVTKAQLILSYEIKIISPTNTTYSHGPLTLEISHTAFVGNPVNFSMAYSLDGKNNETIPITIKLVEPKPFVDIITGSVTLPELSEGSHRIIVYEKCDYSNNNPHVQPFPGTITQFYENTVYFTIDDGQPPIISNLSIENKTYNQNKLLLNFTTDEPASWTGYSLDQQANVTVTGNMILTEFSEGSHRIVVYSNDTAGNMGASEPVTFTVDTPEPFPTALVTASVVSIAAIIAGLAFYFKKHKR